MKSNNLKRCNFYNTHLLLFYVLSLTVNSFQQVLKIRPTMWTKSEIFFDPKIIPYNYSYLLGGAVFFHNR